MRMGRESKKIVKSNGREVMGLTEAGMVLRMAMNNSAKRSTASIAYFSSYKG